MLRRGLLDVNGALRVEVLALDVLEQRTSRADVQFAAVGSVRLPESGSFDDSDARAHLQLRRVLVGRVRVSAIRWHERHERKLLAAGHVEHQRASPRGLGGGGGGIGVGGRRGLSESAGRPRVLLRRRARDGTPEAALHEPPEARLEALTGDRRRCLHADVTLRLQCFQLEEVARLLFRQSIRLVLHTVERCALACNACGALALYCINYSYV